MHIRLHPDHALYINSGAKHTLIKDSEIDYVLIKSKIKPTCKEQKYRGEDRFKQPIITNLKNHNLESETDKSSVYILAPIIPYIVGEVQQCINPYQSCNLTSLSIEKSVYIQYSEIMPNDPPISIDFDVVNRLPHTDKYMAYGSDLPDACWPNCKNSTIRNRFQWTAARLQDLESAATQIAYNKIFNGIAIIFPPDQIVRIGTGMDAVLVKAYLKTINYIKKNLGLKVMVSVPCYGSQETIAGNGSNVINSDNACGKTINNPNLGDLLRNILLDPDHNLNVVSPRFYMKTVGVGSAPNLMYSSMEVDPQDNKFKTGYECNSERAKDLKKVWQSISAGGWISNYEVQPWILDVKDHKTASASVNGRDNGCILRPQIDSTMANRGINLSCNTDQSTAPGHECVVQKIPQPSQNSSYINMATLDLGLYTMPGGRGSQPHIPEINWQSNVVSVGSRPVYLNFGVMSHPRAPHNPSTDTTSWTESYLNMIPMRLLKDYGYEGINFRFLNCIAGQETPDDSCYGYQRVGKEGIINNDPLFWQQWFKRVQNAGLKVMVEMMGFGPYGTDTAGKDIVGNLMLGLVQNNCPGTLDDNNADGRCYDWNSNTQGNIDILVLNVKKNIMTRGGYGPVPFSYVYNRVDNIKNNVPQVWKDLLENKDGVIRGIEGPNILLKVDSFDHYTSVLHDWPRTVKDGKDDSSLRVDGYIIDSDNTLPGDPLPPGQPITCPDKYICDLTQMKYFKDVIEKGGWDGNIVDLGIIVPAEGDKECAFAYKDMTTAIKDFNKSGCYDYYSGFHKDPNWKWYNFYMDNCQLWGDDTLNEPIYCPYTCDTSNECTLSTDPSWVNFRYVNRDACAEGKGWHGVSTSTGQFEFYPDNCDKTPPLVRGLWYKSWDISNNNNTINELYNRNNGADYTNLFIYFSGQSRLNSIDPCTNIMNKPPSNTPSDVGWKLGWYNNIGGGLDTGIITEQTLNEVKDSINDLVKNGWKGVSFDIEMISLDWYENGKGAADAFNACFEALQNNKLDVLVTFNHDGYTDQMVQDWKRNVDHDLARCYAERDIFIKTLSKSSNITYFSPQCYGELGIDTSYAPLWNPSTTPGTTQVTYCDWAESGAKVIPSITLNGVDDYLGNSPDAKEYLGDCLKTDGKTREGYCVWYPPPTVE